MFINGKTIFVELFYYYNRNYITIQLTKIKHYVYLTICLLTIHNVKC